MSDRYLAFVGTGIGRRLTGLLRLPQPSPLERHHPEQPELRGPILLGGSGELAPDVARILADAGAATVHHGVDAWPEIARAHGLITRRFERGPAETRAGSLVYDATGARTLADLRHAYAFFHDTIRHADRNGRILILARPPEGEVEAATTRRALEGLSRSIGKEARRNIATGLLQVDPGAEPLIDSTVRFLLSARSAYVSGQVVRVRPACAPHAFDWQRPQAGRTVLVTGAARGIGAAIAEVFAREGARLVLLDVPAAAAPLAALAGRLDAASLLLDLTTADAPARLAADASARGGYDAVIHNAGITRDRTIARMTEADWDRVLALNLEVPLRLTVHLHEARLICNAGRVVCVSSIAGLAGNAGQTNYSASKAGVIGMVGALAPILAERAITITAVAPGFIETAMTEAIPFALREAGRRLNMMGQGGQPVDVAETIAWLAHPASTGLTGNVVRVCGQSLLGA